MLCLFSVHSTQCVLHEYVSRAADDMLLVVGLAGTAGRAGLTGACAHAADRGAALPALPLR